MPPNFRTVTQLKSILLIVSAALLISAEGLLLVVAAENESEYATQALVRVFLLMGVGFALGSLLVSLQRQIYRTLGFVPIALLAAGLCLGWAVWRSYFGPALMLGMSVALIFVPCLVNYQFKHSWQHQVRSLASLSFVVATTVVALGLLLWGIYLGGYLSWRGELITLGVPLATCAAVAFTCWTREFLELVFETILWPVYRVQVWGPGLSSFPKEGPVIVFANHAAWFDPLWLGKTMPRPLIPLMTSKYFDLPVLHWLMGRVVGAIRVQEAAFRRQAPELDEAIKILDRGECLLIFPEGGMKRKPEQVLHPFGQGVWRILEHRPKTPVIACWIEGNWGSSTSYCNGPPFKGKPLDWWRRIDIGVAPPEHLLPEILTDQREARQHLMDACLGARRYIRG
jgi:1-acyl-sn-glycerol-3-phosphate acyltransferase